MANDLTGNPWVVDTPAATDLTVTVFGQSTRVYIKSLRWAAEGAAGGNNAIVKDAAGHTLWEATATAANYGESEMIEKWVAGIQVPTLEAGKIYITIG